MHYMDRTTKEYPLNRWQVMSRNMSISSAIEWDDATLEALNVYPVWARAADTIPSHGEKHVEGDPQEIDGRWYQSWVLTQLNPEELQVETDRRQQPFIFDQDVITEAGINMSLSPDTNIPLQSNVVAVSAISIGTSSDPVSQPPAGVIPNVPIFGPCPE